MTDSPDSFRPLDHPLPAGMRDLLPDQAVRRRRLAHGLLRRFALHGYAVVTPPVYEFADTLELGLGTLAADDMLRFIEPETGEVAALRPDMTPQIARIVATRLRAMPPPIRLGYEGTVVRRRSGRARKHRQIPQVGVELAGVTGPAGDLELLLLADAAVRDAGLTDFTIDIGTAGVARALLAGLPSEAQAGVSEALAHRDGAEVAARCKAVAAPHSDAIESLSRLHGRRDALVEGARRLAQTPAAQAAADLLALFDSAAAAGLGPTLTADLGEVRGFAYYTGTLFHVYAAGTGDAFGSGGRYDELLGRFGWDLPAAGLGLDLDRLDEALRAAGVSTSPEVRAVVVGPPTDARIAILRSQGVVAVGIREVAEALAWAKAWGFSHVLGPAGWVDAASGASIAPPVGERFNQ